MISYKLPLRKVYVRPMGLTQIGFSLVELMIAMTLALFLLGIIITIFLSSKSAYTTSSQLAITQENTRFASLFLQRDIRSAGYNECGNEMQVNSLLKTNIDNGAAGIYGWNFENTGHNDPAYDLIYQNVDPSGDIATARTANQGNANQWTGSGGANLSTLIHNQQPLRGSDIILLVRDEEVDLTLKQLNNINKNVLNVDEQIKGILDQGQILKIGDCTQVDKFQNIASQGKAISAGSGGNAYQPGNKNGSAFKWARLWGSQNSVYAERSTAYYIGTGASGLPALFKIESTCNLTVATCTANTPQPNEIVDGVESMQILYGEDTDATQDFIANIYRSADDVVDFERVVSVKISLLIRSPSNAKAILDQNDYLLANSVLINPPDNRTLRFVTNETIYLRNKGI